MRSILNIFLANVLCLLLAVNTAAASTITRPYGSSDYLGGAPAVGPKVNAEFDNIVTWLNGGNIASGNVASFGIATSNLADNSVTHAKLANLGQQRASLSVTSIATTAATSIPGSVTLTTTGRPVFILLNGDVPGSATLSSAVGISIASSTQTTIRGKVAIYRDGATVVCAQLFEEVKAVAEVGFKQTIPPSSIACIDVPTAGSHTYQVYGSTAGNSDATAVTLTIPAGTITAFEL